MNRELIKKHRAEFEHWVNGGDVLAKCHKGWEPVEPWSMLTKTIIIINDDYVEFRKALAEGKTIQVDEAHQYGDDFGWLDGHGCYWVNTPKPNFSLNLHCYRIKPDEPKFKVGDFVRTEYNAIYQITETNLVHGTEHFKPWKPQPNEWCWFWDDSSQRPIISQFIGMSNGGSYLPDIASTCYSHCEPFIGTLPTHL